ncbi:hypothetical protein KSP40_PGU014738 [Platanthera guangdongensis]|uniref:EF-hand domain-containing protein n=1 Tax=Platanthera guangdongensis TaxID=2320717 RepID=A0ABR2LG32_9ASPA
MSGAGQAIEQRIPAFPGNKMEAKPAAESEHQQAPADGCNPVKKPGPVSMDHVLLALRETREEREVRIRGLFNVFDTAGVGYLDYALIEAGLSSLRIPTEYKYARDLLKVCDANRDGRVDYLEFRRYMDDKELELYRIFEAIDVEHNGCILPEELWDALVKAVTACLLRCFPSVVGMTRAGLSDVG